MENALRQADQDFSAIDPAFKTFLTDEVLPLTGLQPEAFWQEFQALIEELSPKNQELLAERERLQRQIDDWHKHHRHQTHDAAAYRNFLSAIGYLQAEPAELRVCPTPVDEEVAEIAGPQLVVPLKNARFAINAANARWGSLYDALYGSDAIDLSGDLAPGKNYNPLRGAAVIKQARDFLDATFPLVEGSHHEATRYLIKDGELAVKLQHCRITHLKHPEQWIGTIGADTTLRSVFLRNHGLHVEIRIDRSTSPGAEDLAGIQDIMLESALTTIMDAEDSVAAVDVEDKIDVYRNWLGLMRGDLTSSFEKDGVRQIRTLNCDRVITARDGARQTLRGRSLMLIRNVGLLMNSELVRDRAGNEAPEGIIDAVVTALIGSLDTRGPYQKRNSQCGNIYIVKPKLHGPAEVAFTDQLMSRVEDLLRLPRHTIKLGIMDEERRTTVNLASCLDQAKHRVVFINTGFLDRTGDEIHTCMQAGAVLPKDAIKNSRCIRAYEDRNVDIGLASGLNRCGQIGKGMWPKPDNMAEMLTSKQAHPRAGASTAWVPSPTAATLHALHYHQVDVAAMQDQLMTRTRASLDDILTPPLLGTAGDLSAIEIRSQLRNNIQGILGYVVRWVNQGIGCSKVPDIHQVGLMEDRATLRISSQHIANWLLHGLCTQDQVLSIMEEMAELVDQQNHGDPDYRAMTPNSANSLAFQAACELIMRGTDQPSGYTEPILHRYRQLAKEQLRSA